MTKRLTEKQKEEIVKSFKSGMTIDSLSEKYSCTNNTIIRNLKKSLGDSKFKESLNITKSLEEKSRKNKKNASLKEKVVSEDLNKDSFNYKLLNENINASNFAPIDAFFEIAPMDLNIDTTQQKDLSSVSITEVELPKIVYMVVDKEVELETKLLREFAEWNFLSEKDLNRKTIEIFYDLKSAKKSSKKEQRVIKVPNSDVFKITAPILLSRGISRIVSSEVLIAL